MSAAELKIDLIRKITKLKEVRIIEEIQKFLDFEFDKGEYKVLRKETEFLQPKMTRF